MNREMRRKSARNKNAGKQALEAFRKRQEIGAWVDSAVNDTLMVTFLILHDKFGFGKARLQRIREEITKMSAAMEAGYLDFDDVVQAVKGDIFGGRFEPLEAKKGA